jgi:hypothetical protein
MICPITVHPLRYTPLEESRPRSHHSGKDAAVDDLTPTKATGSPDGPTSWWWPTRHAYCTHTSSPVPSRPRHAPAASTAAAKAAAAVAAAAAAEVAAAIAAAAAAVTAVPAAAAAAIAAAAVPAAAVPASPVPIAHVPFCGQAPPRVRPPQATRRRTTSTYAERARAWGRPHGLLRHSSPGTREKVGHAKCHWLGCALIATR